VYGLLATSVPRTTRIGVSAVSHLGQVTRVEESSMSPTSGWNRHRPRTGPSPCRVHG